MDQTNEIMEYDLKYAALGLKVFPVASHGKKPAHNGWQQEATDDPEKLRSMFTGTNYNIGIATGTVSNLIVIDVDNHNGVDGADSLRAWEQEHDKLPDTATVITGTGGTHYYYRTSKVIKGRTGVLDGVDIRAEGNLIVAPPSIHPNGNSYKWDLGADIDDVGIAEADEVVLELAGWNESTAVSKKRFELPDIIHEGERDSTLWRYASSLRSRRVKALEIIKRVNEANTKRCSVPMSETEIDNIVNQVLNYPEGSSIPDVKPDEDPDLDFFHMHNKKGDCTGVFDVRIKDYIKDKYPMFMIGKLPYIYDHGYYKADLTGAKLKTLICKLIYPEYVKSTTIKRVYDLFASDDELQATYEDCNNYSDKLVNFKNGMFDPVHWKMKEHSPTYKSINQIPFEFDPYNIPDRNCVDDFLEKAIPDPDDREMDLEYISYCFTKDTTQQTFLILVGVGGSGKSTLIRLIIYAIGKENVSSVPLKGLNERFATADLVGKLLNSCADLEEGALDDPTTIKKLLGEDGMRGERKGQDAFDFNSYAGLIFSSNDIPVIKGERSDGFYRRLLICPMNVKPEEIDPELSNKLREAAPRFIYLCMKALQRLYKRGSILRSTHSIKLCEQLRSDSDSVQAFLDERTEAAANRKIERGFLYEKYLRYCDEYERKQVTKNRFYTSMRAKGFHESRDSGSRYFTGIRLKYDTKADTNTDTFDEVNDMDPNRLF